MYNLWGHQNTAGKVQGQDVKVLYVYRPERERVVIIPFYLNVMCIEIMIWLG